MDTTEILSGALARLDYEIGQQTSPSFLGFMLSMQNKGHVSDGDLAELKGYRKGLSVAKEIMERIIRENCEAEQWVSDDVLCESCRNTDCPLVRLRML